MTTATTLNAEIRRQETHYLCDRCHTVEAVTTVDTSWVVCGPCREAYIREVGLEPLKHASSTVTKILMELEQRATRCNGRKVA